MIPVFLTNFYHCRIDTRANCKNVAVSCLGGGPHLRLLLIINVVLKFHCLNTAAESATDVYVKASASIFLSQCVQVKQSFQH